MTPKAESGTDVLSIQETAFGRRAPTPRAVHKSQGGSAGQAEIACYNPRAFGGDQPAGAAKTGHQSPLPPWMPR